MLFLDLSGYFLTTETESQELSFYPLILSLEMSCVFSFKPLLWLQVEDGAPLPDLWHDMPHFQVSRGALFAHYNVNKHISSKDPSKILWFVLCTKTTWPGEEHLHQSGVLHEDSSPIIDLWVRNYYLLKVVDTSNKLFSTNYSTTKVYAISSAESLDVWGYLSYIEWNPTWVWSY